MKSITTYTNWQTAQIAGFSACVEHACFSESASERSQQAILINELNIKSDSDQQSSIYGEPNRFFAVDLSRSDIGLDKMIN